MAMTSSHAHRHREPDPEITSAYHSRACLSAPWQRNVSISVVVSEAELKSRGAIAVAVLRELLYKRMSTAEVLRHTAPPSNSKEDTTTAHEVKVVDGSPAPPLQYTEEMQWVVVHVSGIEPKPHSAQPLDRRRASIHVSATATLCVLEHYGMSTGVAEVSPYEDTLVVRMAMGRIRSSGDTSGAASSRKRDREGAHAEGDGPLSSSGGEPASSEVRVLARQRTADSAQVGQVVVVCCDAAGISCIGLQHPRDAPGPFRVAKAEEGEKGGFTVIECDAPQDEGNHQLLSSKEKGMRERKI